VKIQNVYISGINRLIQWRGTVTWNRQWK